MTDRIQMVHGSGGSATGELIHELFAEEFQSETLNLMEDSAVLDVPEGERVAFTTDSFVVTPLEFHGGDIGRLSVCGTVNDLLMRGAVPKYLTCAAILEEGLEIGTLKRIVHSMAETAREAGVQIVAGDTKVVEAKGRGDASGNRSSARGETMTGSGGASDGISGSGLFLNTSGIGFVHENLDISAGNASEGDAIIVSGTMGDHHAAILGARLGMENSIESDAAPLTEMVGRLIREGVTVHTLRDVTRGGLGTVLKELADASGCIFDIEEERIPVNSQVRDFCGLLGLDPLYMGNEGKLVAIVAAEEAERALGIIRTSRYGENAAVIGKVRESGPKSSLESGSDSGTVILHTPIGGQRVLDVLEGEGLPRIC